MAIRKKRKYVKVIWEMYLPFDALQKEGKTLKECEQTFANLQKEISSEAPKDIKSNLTVTTCYL